MNNDLDLHCSQTLHESVNDEDDDRNDRAIAEDCRNIEQAVTNVLPSVSTGDEEMLPFGYGEFNVDALVKVRFQHQTEQAANGIRLKGNSEPADGEKEISIRRQLNRKYYEALRQQRERGVGTGCDHAVRMALQQIPVEPGMQPLLPLLLQQGYPRHSLLASLTLTGMPQAATTIRKAFMHAHLKSPATTASRWVRPFGARPTQVT